MKAINITKFDNHTEHYYASFWDISSYIDLKNIKNGYLNLEDEVFTNKEKENSFFLPIKDSNEKDLLKEAKKILTTYCGIAANIIIVFYKGKYSESRTNYLTTI